jgi:DNA-binding transcriptional LysR family regulator
MELDLREIEAFLALSQELHFGRAAERLYISRPRMSQLIRNLERQVGGPLFVRTSRRVGLTAIGKDLAIELAAAHKQLYEALDRARAATRHARTHFRVGFYSVVIADLLTDVLLAFEQRFPDIAVSLIGVPWYDPFGPLRRGEVDVMAAWTPLNEADLTVGPAFSQQSRILIAAENHPLAGKAAATIEDVADFGSFELWPPFPEPLRDAVLPATAPSGRTIDRQPVIALSHAVTLASSGLRVHASVTAAKRTVARTGLAQIPIPQLSTLTAAIVWQAAAENPIIPAFAETVQEACNL